MPRKSLLVTAATLILLTGCSEGGEAEAPASETPTAAESEAAQTPARQPGPNAVQVGSGKMDPALNVAENLMNVPEFSTFLSAAREADLLDKLLANPGPITVFVPTNAAFEALPDGTMEGLMQPGSEAELAAIIAYHVYAGRVSAADLMRSIEGGTESMARLSSSNNYELTARQQGGGIVLTSGGGNPATVTQADVEQVNGMVHVIDQVLIPAE